MEKVDNTPRYLGAAFLGVILTSLASGTAAVAALGSGSDSGVLASVSANAGTMHVAILAGLLNAVGILILGVLLYEVLAGQGRTMARVALLCWVGESVFYTITQVASAGLVRVGADAAGAGTLGSSPYLTLGGFLYHDVFELGSTILMFFYCAGGLLWYSLFFRSRFVPRPLSLFGLACVAVGLVGAAFELLGARLGMLPYAGIGVFELLIGFLLLARGTDASRAAPMLTQAPTDARTGTGNAATNIS